MASSPSNSSTTRPAPLARNLGWAAKSFCDTTRQLSGQNVSLLGGRRVSAGRGVDPIRIGRTRTLAAWAATRRRMGDRRREQRNRRVPAQPAGQGEITQPQRENLGVDGRRVAKQFHRRGAGAGGRRERMLRAGHDVPQGLGEAVETRGVRQIQEDQPRFAGSAHRAAIGRDANRRHSRCTRPAGLVGASRRRWREMLGVAQRGRILAMARQGGAGGRRRAGPGAGAARRRTADRREEFGRTERARRRRGKPPRSPRRRRQRLVSAAAPKTEMPVATAGWSARNSARRAGATAAAARRRAPRRADRRREFRHRRRRRDRIGPWP